MLDACRHARRALDVGTQVPHPDLPEPNWPRVPLFLPLTLAADLQRAAAVAGLDGARFVSALWWAWLRRLPHDAREEVRVAIAEAVRIERLRRKHGMAGDDDHYNIRGKRIQAAARLAWRGSTPDPSHPPTISLALEPALAAIVETAERAHIAPPRARRLQRGHRMALRLLRADGERCGAPRVAPGRRERRYRLAGLVPQALAAASFDDALTLLSIAGTILRRVGIFVAHQQTSPS